MWKGFQKNLNESENFELMFNVKKYCWSIMQRLYFGTPGGWRKVLEVVDDRIGFFEIKKRYKMWKIGQKTGFFEFIKKFK